MPMQTNRDFATLLKDLLAESENDGRGLAGPASVSFDYLAVGESLTLDGRGHDGSSLEPVLAPAARISRTSSGVSPNSMPMSSMSVPASRRASRRR